MAGNKNPEDKARREFLQGAGATAVAAMGTPKWMTRFVAKKLGMTRSAIPGLRAEDADAIRAEIEKRHDESVQRLRTWIKLPSIAAENRAMHEGCELMMQMLREAGFGGVWKMTTDGQTQERRRRWGCISCTT